MIDHVLWYTKGSSSVVGYFLMENYTPQITSKSFLHIFDRIKVSGLLPSHLYRILCLLLQNLVVFVLIAIHQNICATLNFFSSVTIELQCRQALIYLTISMSEVKEELVHRPVNIFRGTCQ